MNDDTNVNVAECVADFRRRVSLGETPRPEEYRDKTGDSYAEFLRTISDATLFDEAPSILPEDVFPRTFGDYELIGVLGRGAMGVVYDARDHRLDRRVALKILRTDLGANSPALERFRREARACSKIRHPSIVEIYEAGEVDGRPFYAMARLDGRTLAAHAAEGDLPDSTELFKGFSGIADALGALHAAGIVHRDVKPSNIMVEPDGGMILADFGLARVAVESDLTQTGEALGTPRYMSPEQALGKQDEVDGRTDVYGLGATIYEVCSGGQLFKADDTRGMLHKILTERPRALAEVAPNLPPECSAVVMKSLEKRPKDRYPTASEMRDDLLAIAEGRSVVGRPVSPLTHWFRKWRLPGVAAAVVLVALGLGMMWHAARPGTLIVLSQPPSEVIVDGEEMGPTPLTIQVEPGMHEIVLRRPGFKDSRHPVTVEAGEKRTLERIMVAEDPEDPVALNLIAQAMAIPPAPEPVPVASEAVIRAGGVADQLPGGLAVYPRGALRPEDLDSFQIHIAEGLDGEAQLKVERDGEVLYTRAVDGKSVGQVLPFPPEVRRRLRSGDKLTWGLYARDGKKVEATIHIVLPPQVARQAAELDRRLKDQDPRLLRHMKARLYLANGLDYAALKEARKLAESGKASPHAWFIMCKAMERMNLAHTPECQKLKDMLAEHPEALRQVRQVVEARRAGPGPGSPEEKE